MLTEINLALDANEITPEQYNNLKEMIDAGIQNTTVADLYDHYLELNIKSKQRVTRGSNYVHIH